VRYGVSGEIQWDTADIVEMQLADTDTYRYSWIQDTVTVGYGIQRDI